MGASRIGRRMPRRRAKPSARTRGDGWLLSNILKTSGSMIASRVHRRQSRIKDKDPTSADPTYWISTLSSDAMGEKLQSEYHVRSMADLSVENADRKSTRLNSSHGSI